MSSTPSPYYGIARTPGEWSFHSTRPYTDPFNEVELDVCIEDTDGNTWEVPAFWAGENEWRVRFAAPVPGCYTYRTRCTHPEDRGLHEVAGQLEIAPYAGKNEFLSHGSLRISADRRHFEYEDGTPFFWLGDTWWMALTRRLEWPEEYQVLAAERVAKGFNVIQIVAGLYPDMNWGDERGFNEAGLPYNADLTQINPAYYDMADLRIGYLVRMGLLPCIVGCWGYFLKWMGVERMKKHWRYLVARWGAYPVVWCLAGEAMMPYYLSETKDADAAEQKAGWTELARYVREIDPMQRLLTIHPTDRGRDQVEDDSLLDFEMLQTGHGGHESIPFTVAAVSSERERTPAMPIINAEVNYEGIMGGNYDDVQRIAFWTCLLSGAAGHTYGANGIWQVNGREQPYGPSPHGNNWGNRSWDDAMRLPGSAQMGLGKAILERYGWWNFEPHAEWVSPAATPEKALLLYAAGIPRRVRVIYMCRGTFGVFAAVHGIEAEVSYAAKFINPSTGQEFALGTVEPDANGTWNVPLQPELRDWLLVLEASPSLAKE